MTALHRHAERYSPTGSISADGAKNTLGRPRLALPELLLREALQNSCDAQDVRRAGALFFDVAFRTLTSVQADVLRTAFADLPGDGLALGRSLSSREIRVLTIADRGTTGLGGPTRADVPTPPGTSRDFVDLLRNIGQPPDREFGSGTYGYGKSVLFRASGASTILVHTRCQLADGHLQSRLLGAALGHGHEDKGVLMTGRHWWGVADCEVGAEPVVDEDADRLADELGLPPIDGTGTTILVIDPQLGDDFPIVARRIADAGLLYAWPRLAGIEGIPELNLAVSVEGAVVPVPDPGNDPHVAGFVKALRKLRADECETLRCHRPRKDLGRFAFETVSPVPPPMSDDDEDPGPRHPFVDGLRHTALMRHAHLVIAYRPGPQHHVPDVAWSAVFVADDALDKVFADAEPPSHDEWNHELLASRSHERTFVKTAKARIDEATGTLTAPPEPRRQTGGSGDTPLGLLADALAGLVSSVGGPAPGGPPPGGADRTGAGRGAGARRSRVLISDHRHEYVATGVNLAVHFSVEHAPGTTETIVEANVSFAVDEGGGEGVGPPPVGWRAPDGTLVAPGRLTVTGSDTWALLVPQPDDVGLVVDVSPVAGQA